MNTLPERILIFGGTFDPPHLAHTKLPPIVADKLGCNRILYIPAAINPLKVDSPPTDATHRLAMLHEAVQDVPGAEIRTLELDRSGPSYTVDTLQAMREEFGDEAELRLLLGADQALEFHKWKDWQRILQLATPIVMLRPPWDVESFRNALRAHMGDQAAARWLDWTIQVPEIAVSSTKVRSRVERGGQLDDLVDPRVAAYIRKHGLYLGG